MFLASIINIYSEKHQKRILILQFCNYDKYGSVNMGLFGLDVCLFIVLRVKRTDIGCGDKCFVYNRFKIMI